MSRMLVRAAALLSLLTLLAAGPAVAATVASANVTSESAAGTGTCMAAAYAMYNACLMSSDSYWSKVLCDVAFQLNAMTCKGEAN